MLKHFMTGLLIVACIISALLLFGAPAGGSGYFSPDTLEYCSQSNIGLGTTGIPLCRGSFKYHQHELVTYLVDKGYWQARSVGSPRWILLFEWAPGSRDGETSFHRQFFWKKTVWIRWTDENPEEAARLWPRVLELLRENREEKATEMLFEILLK